VTAAANDRAACRWRRLTQRNAESYSGDDEPPLPPPQGQDEATVLAPILNLIETKQPLPSLELFSFGGDSDSAFPAAPTYPYAERVLQSVARNPSIQEIKFDCGRISFQAAAQLFQLATKKLVIHCLSLSTERGSQEMLISTLLWRTLPLRFST